MEDEEFISNIRKKIEYLAGREIELEVDQEAENPVVLDINAPVPKVVFGGQIMKYPGLARMAVEYVTACIKEERPLQKIPLPCRFPVMVLLIIVGEQ